MGGGRANFLPRSAEGSKRKDESDFVGQFRDAGYSVASTGAEMTSLADDLKTTKLVGLFSATWTAPSIARSSRVELS